MKFTCIALPILISTLAPVHGAPAGDVISFNKSIQPILSENCYHCHGPDSGTREPKKEPLRLDREKYAFNNRENGKPVIIKGDPAASLLVKLLKSKDPDEVMPPPKALHQLTAEQIKTIETWVAQGAVYEEHWAFIPPKRATVPTVAHPELVNNPIDAFVQAKLASSGLSPRPDEDPRTLIRRATLDLTGLLPEPADVEAFAKDPSEQAYQAHLKKLFASAAYAEHRTRYWLDYARYADTHGLHFDNVSSVWPYRDYVIRSFAANKPFNQFVREQLAGDLIPAPTADTWIATGYIRCSVSSNEGGTIPEELLVNNTRDRAEAFGADFLGLTVGCAACHDHKFDPTAQKDFYSLGAFFANTAEKPWDENVSDSAPALRLPPPDKQKDFDAAVSRRSQAAMEYEKRRSEAPAHFRQWLTEGHKLMPVSDKNLELHLLLNEGKGDDLHNSAPGAKTLVYKADTNPLIWGEKVWFWPAMRMDISSNVPMPDLGDYEMSEGFSAATWANLRLKTANQGTGGGALISRMGAQNKDDHRGWEMYSDGGKLVVHIIHKWPDKAIRVEASGVPSGEWVHLGFSYDGSGKAEGVKLFINGEEKKTGITNNSLEAGMTIRNQLPLNIGQRYLDDRLKEISLQDVRVYHRTLDPAEFSRLPYEDIGATIMAVRPDPQTWNAREKFIVFDRFFLPKVDTVAGKLLEQIAAEDATIAELGKGGPATLIARERSAPAAAWILNRGVYTARKEMVTPATPEFLPNAKMATNRLDLAEWLFKPENPLFARVTVNRAWQEVFGVGLVETSDDFGVMGTKPSNQELLDWLAVEFRESGWDLRHIYELMLSSHTYRQSNQITKESLAGDPANRLLSRGPRFRMDAEVLRDTALQASGLLVSKVGGPPVKPYQPGGIWESVSMPESDTLHYKQDNGDALYRRSMYTFWKRFAPPPSLETFDAQARETVCIRRTRTNTPLQALVSMNDPQFMEAARKLAERVIAQGSDVESRLAFLSETLISRPLTAKEVTSLSAKLKTYSDYYKGHPDDAKGLLTTGAAPANASLDPIEIATWAVMANQFLNLDEAINK